MPKTKIPTVGFLVRTQREFYRFMNECVRPGFERLGGHETAFRAKRLQQMDKYQQHLKDTAEFMKWAIDKGYDKEFEKEQVQGAPESNLFDDE